MLPSETPLLQRYRLEHPLGRGGAGTVYRAHDAVSGQPVAVKIVLAGADPVRRAFEREAHLLALLDHPALPAVLDHFNDGDAQCLVMTFVPGADLAEQLARQAAPFPVDVVLNWADQLLDLLGYLHSRQPRVIHRDIKPDNLKIGADGRIVLLDFGLAKGLSDSQAVSLAGYTVSYAPPEQLRGEGTEPRSDLYALAATLYELLTRRRPVDALQREAAAIAGLADPLAPVPMANPAVPAAVAAVIGQALSLRPGGRPATARSMQVALREALDGPVTVLAPASAVPAGFGPVQRPTGTVAFFATQIAEGCCPSASALARHDSLLRAAVDAHGGSVFRNDDDGLSAAFTTADAALAAALDAQRALRDERWNADDSLAVRMALHAGAADLVGDEYVSAVLPRLTRLLAAGHGGQILAPRSVQELSGTGLPAGVSLRDLSRHCLPGLAEAEHVYQIVAADLPADFPPLASREVRSSDLPAATTVLIGRERELVELAEHLRRPSVRLLTLTGPGGTGKTRLALAAAEALLDDFADGVYFVPLAAVRDPRLVVAEICRMVGIREGPGQSQLDALRAELRDRHVLLVLDNLEQVLAAGESVAELVATTRHLKVLVTSRVLFRQDGEHEFAVPTLDYPTAERLTLTDAARYPAIELFVTRARSATQGFALTAGNVAAVAAICARLDGLPLAIELTAARVNLFSPADLLDRLAQRLTTLTAERHDLPARQQTLRATLAWSYTLLSPAEQQLFARLGIFAGGFDLEAADAICSSPDDPGMGVVAGLAALGDQSLLRRDTTPDGDARYLMLETVREYAAERLAAGDDEAAVRQRHAEWFMTLAEAGDAAIAGPAGGAWLARLAVEHDNQRAALDWLSGQPDAERALALAAALWRFWMVQGHLSEGRGWLEQSLERSDSASPERARALVGAGALALRQQDTPAARRWLDEAVTLCRSVDEPAGLATALKHLGLIALYDDPPDYALAVECFEESLDLRRGLDDLDGVASCLNDIANVAIEQGDYDRASTMLDESLAICRSFGNHYGMSFVLHNLSLVELERDEYDHAAELIGEGLDLVDELGSRERIGCDLWGIACVAAARGRVERAARLFGGAEALRESAGAAFSPAELATLERKIEPARLALGQQSWAVAVAAGRDLPVEDLIAEARVEIATSGRPPEIDRQIGGG